ncbi:hypothetical protein D3C78_870870 [compost metagenome]
MRIEQLCRLGHEMHAGENDHIRFHFHRLAGKGKAVADDIGDAVEDFRCLVIMGEDDRVSLALQLEDRIHIVLKAHPFGLGNDAGDAIIKACGGYLFVHGALPFILSLSISMAKRYSHCEHMSIAGEGQFCT